MVLPLLQFNGVIFWTWIVAAILDSLIIFGLTSVMMREGLMLPDGTVADLWFFGTTIFTINILTVTFKAALIADFWSLWTHIAFWGSVSLWFLFILCYGSLWPFLADAVTVCLPFPSFCPSCWLKRDPLLPVCFRCLTCIQCCFPRRCSGSRAFSSRLSAS